MTGGATAAGAPQVVLLAAGLDARAFRLEWPTGTTIYEVDQPRVLAFKDRVLRDEGARPRTARHVVPTDLRGDWSRALRTAGLDPTRRTVWLAEGLLPFLPADAEAALLRTVSTHAAPGSTFVVDDFAEVVGRMRLDPGVARFGRPYGIDMSALPDPVLDRPRPGDQLVEQGWSVEQITGAVSLASTYGRSMPTSSSGLNLDSQMVVARR